MKGPYCSIHLYEISRLGKSMETEESLLPTWEGTGREKEFLGYENVPLLDSGD